MKKKCFFSPAKKTSIASQKENPTVK